jgi:hypothetical protein
MGRVGDDDEFWACKKCAEHFVYDRFGKIHGTIIDG